MKSYELVIYLISNFFLTYIIFRFSKMFFYRQNINYRIECIFYIIFFFVSSAVTLIFKNPILNLITNVLGIFTITLIYEDKIFKKFLFTIMIYCLPLPIDIIMSYILKKYISQGVYYAIGNTMVTLIFFIMELIFEVAFKKVKENSRVDSKSIFFIFLPLFSIVMTTLMIYYSNPDIEIIIVQCICILLINIITFNLYDWVIEAFNKKYESDLLERNIESYANQLEIMKQGQDKINSIKHDIKHHILVINDMAKNADNTAILDYLKLLNLSVTNTNEYVKSGNLGVDSILNYMLGKAKSLTNNIRVKVKIPDSIKLNNFDISIIIGNLLDNAIRALQGDEKRELEIDIQYDKGILYIKIENTYSNTLIKNGDKIMSTKRESRCQGIGLGNVKSIVDKYYGGMNIITNNGRFVVDIMLYV